MIKTFEQFWEEMDLIKRALILTTLEFGDEDSMGFHSFNATGTIDKISTAANSDKPPDSEFLRHLYQSWATDIKPFEKICLFLYNHMKGHVRSLGGF